MSEVESERPRRSENPIPDVNTNLEELNRALAELDPQRPASYATLDFTGLPMGYGGACLLTERLEAHMGDVLSLTLGDNNLGVDGLVELGTLLESATRLEDVSLGDNGANGYGLAVVLQGLYQDGRSGPITIALPFSKIDPTDVDTLLEVIGTVPCEAIRLRDLDLSNNNAQDDGVRELARMLLGNDGPQGLVGLDLSSNRITGDGIVYLSEAIEVNHHLRTLRLAANRCGPAGLTALGTALAANATLTSLSLYGCGIEDAALVGFCDGLAANSTLRHLNLASNCITAAGLKVLSAAVPGCRALRILDLSDNAIVGGVRDLARALADHPAMRELDLAKNRVTERGARSLAQVLARSPTMRRLNLSHNRLGSRGVDALRELKRLRALFFFFY
jgi:Ran GTPase-activating protein (RanGAP) involved in mRNA processing and transport